MARIEVFAPAKINLTLHITGQRADGYHLLDSLVGFAGVGDVLRLRTGGAGTLTVTGPEALQVPTDGQNFIHWVAQVFGDGAAPDFELVKNLPVAAGIGGGSADAAACYRALKFLEQQGQRRGQPQAQGAAGDSFADQDMAALLKIGADVPMCVSCAPARVQGIGEALTPVPDLPQMPIVLVNPRVPVPTGAVFKALQSKDNPPMEALPNPFGDTEALFEWLRRQRNDLEAPARGIAPQIDAALAAISAAQGCRLARMSGSGATCFGLFADPAEAEAAAAQIRAAHGGWWVAATRLDGARRAAPQLIRATT